MRVGTLLTGIPPLARLFTVAFAPMFLLAFSLSLAGCSSDDSVMRDGYYSARSSSFNEDGWQGFVTLYIHNNRIITAEYNERNASGLIMGWDTRYLSHLKKELGVHPNQLVREYTRELLNRQDPSAVRRAPGDTRFYNVFVTLASAAVSQARAGDRTVFEQPLPKADTAGPDTLRSGASRKAP